MILYDGSSDIDWFWIGTKTADEMREDAEFSELFEQSCILFDDGAGKVYDYARLDDVAERYGVPRYLSDEARADEVIAKFGGTYKAPGVEQAQATADEAKTTADTTSASVNEYMDALLGLNTTDETGATDAE